MAPGCFDRQQSVLVREVEKVRMRKVQLADKRGVVEAAAAAAEEEEEKCQLEGESRVQPSAGE